MSTIQTLVRIGAGALQAGTQRMATVQHNIANAQTQGYRRQRADLKTLGRTPSHPDVRRHGRCQALDQRAADRSPDSGLQGPARAGKTPWCRPRGLPSR